MNITSDWHIHSRNSCDSACMTMADLVADAAAAGITDYGITDHVHTPFNLPDIAAAEKMLDTIGICTGDLWTLPPKISNTDDTSRSLA